MRKKDSLSCCPVEKTVSLIGKKWMLHIVRDLFLGKKRFSEFLCSNKELSNKVLAARLKELEKAEIIKKEVVSTTPIVVQYTLTDLGKELNRILYELARFSVLHCHITKKSMPKKAVLQKLEVAFGVR
jgi:DNA-binding HxlR family transcriptional regulator